MTKLTDETERLLCRARRFSRGIALAVMLTFAALLALYATLWADARTEASTGAGQLPAVHAPLVPVNETGSITPVRRASGS
jgi:TRAP-type C4-dicarboxylate transport system permease small subunit